jgi:hypothetical protein
VYVNGFRQRRWFTARAGTAAIVVRLTKRGRALLREVSRLRITVQLRFRGDGGRVTTVESGLVLKR